MNRTSRSRARGTSLIEVLVALALAALLVGGMFTGVGMLRQARLREGSTLVASAVRIAYDHANATSRVTRLVFDFEQRTITMEETQGLLFLQQNRTGGAAGASELEKAALEEGEGIVEGPKKLRPTFQTVGHSTLDQVADLRESDDQGKQGGKQLPKEVSFRQIEVQHEDDAATSEHIYLYFWPGGQTERAAIQLQLGTEGKLTDAMTITVKPLTGQVTAEYGAIAMDRPDSADEEADAR